MTNEVFRNTLVGREGLSQSVPWLYYVDQADGWRRVKPGPPQITVDVEKTPKILLFCAHRWEANPFLDSLKMRPTADPSFPFEEFQSPSGQHALYLTGQGAERAAAVAAAVLGRLSRDKSRVVANFGTAGTHRGMFEIGQPTLINRSVATPSGRSVYPDRLVRSDWTEATCYTVPKPGSAPSPPHGSAVYDMELSGILAACELYLQSSQVVGGKVVSDFLTETSPPWRELVAALAEPYREAGLSFLKHLEAQRCLLEKDERNLRAGHAKRQVDRARNLINGLFTVTQSRRLDSALHARALSCRTDQEWADTISTIESLLVEARPESKKERTLLFARLADYISTPTIFSTGIGT